MMRYLRNCLILLAIAHLVGQAGAADMLVTSTVDGVDLKLWIPEGVTKLRGLLVNPADVSVGSGTWAETMRPLGFGQVGIMIKDLKRGSRTKLIQDAFVKSLSDWSASQDHPELTDLPILFCGFSKGGIWSAELAMNMPARAIAYGDVCGWVTNQEKAGEAGRQVPGLFIIGSVPDDYKMLDAIPAQFDTARKVGAPWTLALQWGVSHDYANASALVMPYFEAMVAQRLQADGKLAEVSVAKGWLGNRTQGETPFASISPVGEFKGDPLAAVWLPDKYVAYVWRSFIAEDPPVRIDVEGLPEKGKRSLVVKADAEVAIKTVAKPGQDPSRIEFFDGDEPITSSWKPTRAGAHGIFCTYVGADGKPGISNPVLIVVKK